MKRSISSLGILVLILFAYSAQAAPRRPTDSKLAPSRSFDFTYVVHVPALPAGTHEMRIWLPLPQTDAHQQISSLRVASPVPYHVYSEPQYGNRLAYFAVDPISGRAPFDIKLTPLTKAHKIYEYVIRTMHYDHDGTGWGHGDAIFACTAHHGNCTDFHSLFIGMARAAGIPARFEIGFPLPLNQTEGKISGYHCWAEFYIQGIGWVPIDASEAWQMPAKHDYFFGALDENRVRFSRGRDLMLNPRQAGEAVNYLVYPYAELDGKPFTGLGHDFSFRDLNAAGVRSAAK